MDLKNTPRSLGIDPRDELVAAANEMMFRTGYYTAQRYNEPWFHDRLNPGFNAHNDITGTPTSAVNVFVAEWGYFVGAVAIELITIATILFTFYG